MKLRLLESAREDLAAGYEFYEEQQVGLGGHFLESLFADLDALIAFSGIHPQSGGFHRALSDRFPFGIYYRVAADETVVFAVLDLRRRPSWIRRRLRRSGS